MAHKPIPNELIKMIMGYMPLDVLLICAQVNKAWRIMVRETIKRRRAPVHKLQTMQELWSMTPKPVLGTDDEDDEEKEFKENVAVLKTYDRTFLESSFRFGCVRSDDASMFVGAWSEPKNWVHEVTALRRCNCPGPVVARKTCLVNSVHFMRTQNLIIVGMKGILGFFNDEDPQQPGQAESIRPYTIEPEGFSSSQDPHACISVYHDHFVVSETTRCFIYCQVMNADHDARIVHVERLRRVFLPFWSNDLLLFKEKVFILYTTGYLGVWNANPDSIEISDGPIIPEPDLLAKLSERRMSRMNNLIFIRLKAYMPAFVNEEEYKPMTVWTIMDGDTDNKTMVQIPLVDLANSAHADIDDGFCTQVFQLYIWNNAIIVHYQVQTKKLKQVFFALRTKRDPRLSDFESVENFRSLFFPVISSQQNNFAMNKIRTPIFLPTLKASVKQESQDEASTAATTDTQMVLFSIPRNRYECRRFNIGLFNSTKPVQVNQSV